MATVLVDYENVSGYNGLLGVQYLIEKDDLCIFYSNSCQSITKGDIKDIEESGCSFRICKLKVSRKNALDFYIATEVGVAYESGEKNIIIVSRDSGFNSVCDYFKVTGYEAQVVLAPTIEKGLMQLKGAEDRERRELLKNKSDKVNLVDEHRRIEELKTTIKPDTECEVSTEYQDEVVRELACVEIIETPPKQNVYRGHLYRFGRRMGARIYKILKRVV